MSTDLIQARKKYPLVDRKSFIYTLLAPNAAWRLVTRDYLDIESVLAKDVCSDEPCSARAYDTNVRSHGLSTLTEREGTIYTLESTIHTLESKTDVFVVGFPSGESNPE